MVEPGLDRVIENTRASPRAIVVAGKEKEREKMLMPP